MSAVAGFLSRHKAGLEWLHIGLVVGAVCVAAPLVARAGGAGFSPWLGLWVLVIVTAALSQNIGLIHHTAHRLPRAPGRLGLHAARFLHALGGLSYAKAGFAHRLHHAHLGTSLDPDRAGYESTTTLGRRLRYLLLIGPLRARFAPVQIAAALDSMSTARRAEYEQSVRRDRRLLVATHAALLVIYGAYYPVMLAALVFANVLSNAREMAEHGKEGRGIYVDIRVSPLGVLFFSTPGFWFHGIHHMDAGIHYLDLPLAARSFTPKTDRPYVRRGSALGYLFTGR
jgi:fatty acid desaturase